MPMIFAPCIKLQKSSIQREILARLNRGATTVYWIIDRPEHAPAMRSILHRIRAGLLGGALSGSQQFNIYDRPPRGSEFQKLLTDPVFKEQLVVALAESLLQLGSKMRDNQRIVVDSPGLDIPMAVTAGAAPTGMPELSHTLGEADYAIWHHVKHCEQNKVIVCAGDTDIFMYGMALQSIGALGEGREIVIERKKDEDYLHLSASMRSIDRQYTQVNAFRAVAAYSANVCSQSLNSSSTIEASSYTICAICDGVRCSVISTNHVSRCYTYTCSPAVTTYPIPTAAPIKCGSIDYLGITHS